MQMPSGQPKALTMQLEQSVGDSLDFTIRDDSKIFTDFGMSHTKEMHLIVIRDDLQHFSHVHPTRDEKGVWHIDYKPEAGGTYWIYGDFVDASAVPYTLRVTKQFAGDKGVRGVAENEEVKKTVGGFTIAFAPLRTATSTTLNYIITDASGNAPILEDYLAAKAHIVVLSSAGDFYHLHGSEVQPGVIEASDKIPLASFHRAFLQFQVQGKVLTVPFDLTATL
jgi:hypothetical protein